MTDYMDYSEYKNVPLWIKIKGLLSNIFETVFSLNGLIIFVLIVIITVSAIDFYMTAKRINAPDAPTTINNGIIVDMQDYVQTKKGVQVPRYFIIYESTNSNGYRVTRKDEVTAITYSKYEIGDFFDRDGHIMS